MQPVLLIHPPLVKPSEPPAGLARLAGALKRHDVRCTVVDANLEGLLYLLKRPAGGVSGDAGDIWTKRARRGLEGNLYLLRNPDGYKNADRYRRTVSDVNRVLQTAVPPGNFRLSLSDYEDRQRSPVCSSDLIAAAKRPSDNPFHDYFRERLPALLARRPGCIGLSLNYLSQALCCFAMIGFIRHISPSAKIALGGGLVTSWLQRPNWRDPFAGLVDQWVSGPGEKPLLALLGIDAAPEPAQPDYSAFPLADYLSPGWVLPFSASSGCYWRRCAFCPEKVEAGAYRPLQDREVIDALARWTAPPAAATSVGRNNPAVRTPPTPEAASAAVIRPEPAEDRRPVLIHFLDNALRPSLLKQLTRTPPGIPWYGFARISKDLADPAFCRDLRNSGCAMLKLGIESASQGVLDALDKGIDLDVVSEALQALHGAGIAVYAYLLFGTPPERPVDALQTLDFVAHHHAWIDFLNVALFNLPAFGRDAETLETAAFYPGDLSLYRRFRHPHGWNRPDVRRFLDRVFGRHPAVAAILRRDPPFFTSNHAAFFGVSDTFGPARMDA